MASKKSVKSKARGNRAAKKSLKKTAKKTGKKKSAKKPSRKNPAKKVAAKPSRKKAVAAAASGKTAAAAKHPVLNLILNRLDEDQAANTVQINLANKSTIADWMVVTSGRSNRHVNAIADHVIESLHKNGVSRVRVEGMPNCDWVLIDAGDVILHIFRPEVRAFYNLEKMWTREPAQA